MNRTIKDIESVLEFAKLDKDEIKAEMQSIYFSEHLDNDCIKVLELDSGILQALENGEKIVIRGEKEDSAVLCTSTQTYDIKLGEISNAMLFCPDLKFGDTLAGSTEPCVHYREVNSVVHNFYEMRPCKPRLNKLRTMLQEKPYRGQIDEMDEEQGGNKYTLNDILNVVQSSEGEIMTALDKIHAIVIDGYWRVLDFDFLVQVVTHVLQLCDENDWVRHGIPMEECVTVLQELFSRNVIEHVVKMFADKYNSDTGNKEEDGVEQMQIDIDYYRLNEDKICRFFAEQILKHARKFNLNQFLTTWEKSVPEGMKTSINQLEGMTLIDKDSTPPVISYFPVELLPEDITERFAFLFKTRGKWSLDEITPYIRDLETDKLDVTAMLTKFARASTANGVKLYNSR